MRVKKGYRRTRAKYFSPKPLRFYGSGAYSERTSGVSIWGEGGGMKVCYLWAFAENFRIRRKLILDRDVLQ